MVHQAPAKVPALTGPSSLGDLAPRRSTKRIVGRLPGPGLYTATLTSTGQPG
jgi:hypothetical protein